MSLLTHQGRPSFAFVLRGGCSRPPCLGDVTLHILCAIASLVLPTCHPPCGCRGHKRTMRRGWNLGVRV